MTYTEENTQFCTNCKHDIAASNFTMHILHCQRKLILCKLCKDAFPKDQMEEHKEEYHTLIMCPKCGLKFERYKEEEHLEQCSHRLVECKFCEIEKTFVELAEHESYCGSRTEKCEFCHQFIMIKDKVDHDRRVHNRFSETSSANSNSPIYTKKCQNKSPPRAVHSDNKASKVIPRSMNKRNNDLPQVNTAVPDKSASCSSKSMIKPSATQVKTPNDQINAQTDRICQSRGAEGNQRVNASNTTKIIESCNTTQSSLTTASSSLHDTEHAQSRRLDFAFDNFFDGHRNLNRKSDNKNKNSGNLHDRAAKPISARIPCEICGKLFLKEQIIEHQSRCLRSNNNASGNQSLTKHVKLNQLSNELYSEDQAVDIPCEFCGSPFPFSLIQDHQDNCDYLNVYEKDNSRTTHLQCDDDFIDEIPCEFCHVLFPSQQIQAHQEICDRNPACDNFSKNAMFNFPPSVDLYKEVKTDEFLNENDFDFSLMLQDSNFHVPSQTTASVPHKRSGDITENQVTATSAVPIRKSKPNTENTVAVALTQSGRLYAENGVISAVVVPNQRSRPNTEINTSASIPAERSRPSIENKVALAALARNQRSSVNTENIAPVATSALNEKSKPNTESKVASAALARNQRSILNTENKDLKKKLTYMTSELPVQKFKSTANSQQKSSCDKYNTNRTADASMNQENDKNVNNRPSHIEFDSRRNLYRMTDTAFMSLRHSDLNNYLKEMLLSSLSNENYPNNEESSPNAYESSSSENSRGYNDKTQNKKTFNAGSKAEKSSKSLFYREMKAALNPVSDATSLPRNNGYTTGQYTSQNQNAGPRPETNSNHRSNQSQQTRRNQRYKSSNEQNLSARPICDLPPVNVNSVRNVNQRSELQNFYRADKNSSTGAVPKYSNGNNKHMKLK